MAAPPPVMTGATPLVRDITVTPAMCGYNSLFVGQVGDWTWQTVSELCGTDAFTARDETGAPTYLAFYYYHLRGSAEMHLRRFTFGDRLRVLSAAYGYGSESVLTLHRIAMADTPAARARELDPVEFYERPRADCLYVETFNRWVTRSVARSNRDLVRSTPVDFRHEHLPTLPERYSPRAVYHRARTARTFDEDFGGASGGGEVGGGAGGGELVVDGHRSTYRVDPTRDLNGVGLVYFAAYFSIVDAAVWRLWQFLGRGEDDYLAMRITDERLCYLGNADAGTTLGLTSRLRRRPSGAEVVDVVVEEHGTGRLIAVATLQVGAA
ncbi:LnmK family bifunctional acyltransferase/decarboxylase [Micromonospora sp. DT233]|uniref:LnmK family bifunctional acyltransferase/decarboxylase n=1 Tax=Micromonospora sp. DT233 TaxID=3393432 RepID=UPI003CF6AE5F